MVETYPHAHELADEYNKKVDAACNSVRSKNNSIGRVSKDLGELYKTKPEGLNQTKFVDYVQKQREAFDELIKNLECVANHGHLLRRPPRSTYAPKKPAGVNDPEKNLIKEAKTKLEPIVTGILERFTDFNIQMALELTAIQVHKDDLEHRISADTTRIERRAQRHQELDKAFSDQRELKNPLVEEQKSIEQYAFVVEETEQLLKTFKILEDAGLEIDDTNPIEKLSIVYQGIIRKYEAKLVENDKAISSALANASIKRAEEYVARKNEKPGKNLRKVAAGFGAAGLVGLGAGLTGSLDPVYATTIFAAGEGAAIKALVDSYTLDSWQEDAGFLLDKANKTLESGKNAWFESRRKSLYQKAAKLADEAIGLAPDVPEAYNTCGLAQMHLGKLLKDNNLLEQAVSSFSQAIDLAKDNPEYYYNMANVGLEQAKLPGNTTKGSADILELGGLFFVNQAIKLDSQNVDYHILKGNILSKLKKFDEAIKAYDAGLSLDQNNKAIQNDKAYALWAKGDLEDALKILEKNSGHFFIADGYEDLKSVVKLRNKGDKLFNEGKFTKALETYENAVKIVPDPSLHERLANTKYKLCDFKGAIDEVKAAINICPEYITKDKAVFGSTMLARSLNDSEYVLSWVASKMDDLEVLLRDRAKKWLGDDRAKAFDKKFKNFMLQTFKEHNIDRNKADLYAYLNNLTEDEFPNAEKLIGSISNKMSSFVKNLYAYDRRLTDSIVEFSSGKAHRWYRQLDDSEELWAAFLPGAVTVPLTIATPIAALSGKLDVLLGLTIPNILGWYASAYLANRAINLGCKHELEQEKEALSEFLNGVAISASDSIKTDHECVEFECPLCGATVGDVDVKCPECGAEFDEVEEEEAEEEELPMPSPAPIPSVAAAVSVDDSEEKYVVKKKVVRKPESVRSMLSAKSLENSTEIASDAKKAPGGKFAPVIEELEKMKKSLEPASPKPESTAPASELDLDLDETSDSLDKLLADLEDAAPPGTVVGPQGKNPLVCVPPTSMQPALSAQTQNTSEYIEKLKGDRDAYELWMVMHEDRVTESHRVRLRNLDTQIAQAKKELVDCNSLYLQGKELLTNGKLDDALSTLDKVLETSPGNADAWTTKGSVLEKLGRNEDAIKAYNQAVQLVPGNESYIQAREAVRDKIRALQDKETAVVESQPDSKRVVIRKYVKRYLLVDIPQNVEGNVKKVGDEIYAKAAIASCDTWYKIDSQGQLVNERGELVWKSNIPTALGAEIQPKNKDSLKKFYEKACSFVAKELSGLVWVPVPEESSFVKDLVSELEVPEPVAASPLQGTLKDSTRNQLPENVELTAPYTLPDNVELAKPEIMRDGRAALDEYTLGSDQLVAKLAARQLLYDFNCGRWGELYLNDLKVECSKLEGNLNTTLAESKAQELAKKWGQDFIKREKLSDTYANICVSLFAEYGVTAVKSLSDIRNIKSLQPNRYLSADKIQELLHNPQMQIIDLEQEVFRR